MGRKVRAVVAVALMFLIVVHPIEALAGSSRAAKRVE